MRQLRAERQRFIDQALGVDWRVQPALLRFTDLDRMTSPPSMVELLIRWQDVHGGQAGSIQDVHDFYRDCSDGRLVVLGEPGAGKSMLLSQLSRDLLDSSPLPDDDLMTSRIVIPVMLSLPSLDLGVTREATGQELLARLDVWVMGRLMEDYQIPASIARALLRGRHILPVLDGLDEMDSTPGGASPSITARPRAAAVIRALNHDRSRPAVLACRRSEYEAIATTAADIGPDSPILTDARHVTLQPLSAGDIGSYLADRLGGHSRQIPPRWRPVADALPSHQALLAVLQNPWQLFLAVTAYHRRDSTPTDLLGMTFTQARHHLLNALIPAVTTQHEMAARNGWTPDKVRRWLTSVAEHQSRDAATRGGSAADIRLPELWRISNRRSPRLLPSILAVSPALLWSLYGYLIVGIPGSYALAVAASGVFAGLRSLSAETPLNRMSLYEFRTSRGRRRLARRWAASSIVGLFFGALAFVVYVWVMDFATRDGIVDGILSGFFVTILGFAIDTPVGMEATPSPAALVRQCINYIETVGVLCIIMVGLLATAEFELGGIQTQSAFASVWTFRVIGALVVGITLGFWVGRAYVWLRYALGVRSASRRDLLPTRPARFLDWCLTAGLVRMSGINMQFRHRALQDWLTASATYAQDMSPRQ